MKEVKYKKLNCQDYFSQPYFSTKVKQQIFSFRVRMAQFGENFRGSKEHVNCPFNCIEYDSQQHSYECTLLQSRTTIDGKYEDIFLEKVPIHAGKTVANIIHTRESILEERFLQ